MREVRSLEKRSIDSLVAQLFSQMGGDLRIVGPNAALTPLDARYVGVLKQLLQELIPGIPTDLLSTVRDDLIVISRATESVSTLVSFAPSVLRLSRDHSHKAEHLQSKYGELLNVTVQASRYVDSDMEGPKLRFGEEFFLNRSFKGWTRLSSYFARLCAAMEELRAESGLKQSEVSHGDRETNLVPATFVNRLGEEMELITP